MTVRAARPAALLIAVATLAAWASAQSPTAGLSSSERLGLLKRNRGLVEDLVDDGLRLSERNTPLDRADECVRTSNRLALELRAAVSAADADRVAEVGDLLSAVVTDGFVPNLREAEESIRPNSPGFEHLVRSRDQAQRAADGLVDAIPADGAFANRTRVKAARDKLTAAAGRVGVKD